MSYRIVSLPFPPTVRGCTLEISKGRYLIGINSALSPEQRAKTLRHELRHIELDHFNDPRTLAEIEEEADG